MWQRGEYLCPLSIPFSGGRGEWEGVFVANIDGRWRLVTEPVNYTKLASLSVIE